MAPLLCMSSIFYLIAFLTNVSSTIDNVCACFGAACQALAPSASGMLVTCAPLFVVRASVVRHQAWPAATPDDQGVAAGPPQAADLGPRWPAELWIAAKAQTGLRQRAYQGSHDDWSLDLHWRGQHRWSTGPVHTHWQLLFFFFLIQDKAVRMGGNVLPAPQWQS